MENPMSVKLSREITLTGVIEAATLAGILSGFSVLLLSMRIFG
jgi:hypothetical protein